MTAPEQPQPQPLRGASIAARAGLAGTVATAVLVGVALFLVPQAVWGYLLGGAVVALLASGVGGWLLARAAALPPGDPRNGRMFVQSLVLDFGLQFAAVVIGMLVLRALAVKFAGLAAFGIMFASVALVVHVTGAVLINRALGLRARIRES